MDSSTKPETPIDNKTVKQLAKGVMELYEPPLITISTNIKELTERQDAVHTMLVSERRRLENIHNDAELDALCNYLKRASGLHQVQKTTDRKMTTDERRRLPTTIAKIMANLATDKERLVAVSNSMMDIHKRVQALQARAANVEKAAITRIANRKRLSES